MKTIDQIKDCQAIDLGYNSFRGLVINPKKDMGLNHLNLCIERSMEEYANQRREGIISFIEQWNGETESDLGKKLNEKFLELVYNHSSINPHTK